MERPAPVDPRAPPTRLEFRERTAPVGTRVAASILDDDCEGLECVARSVGDELANMASGIEGHAQLLCEAIGEPHFVASRAEHLWKTVRRLRLFSEKILSFSSVDVLEVKPVRIRPFLVALAQEIESYSGNSISVELTTAEFLPPADACERALKNAVLFLVDTLLALETGANRLSLRAFARISEVHDTRVEIEICAEAEVSREKTRPNPHDIHLGYHAARNLLEAQGAVLSFDQMEGLSVSCYVSLQAAELDALEPPLELPMPESVEPPHEYGGVLILEDDPAIRSLMAHELRSTGRSIVTCVDGASARSLIEATPERFELLILDASARLESGESLACRAAELNPDVKIALLTTGSPRADVPFDDCAVLSKPFGIPELRDCLNRLLSAEQPSRSIPEPDVQEIR